MEEQRVRQQDRIWNFCKTALPHLQPVGFCRLACAAALCGMVLLATPAAAQSRREAPRARLPSFTPEQVSKIFFDNVFEHLVGERPDRSPNLAERPANGTATDPAAAASADELDWVQLISPTTIADEVKSVKIRLDREILAPSSLAGNGASAVRRDFAVIAMLFGIVHEYDGDVRFRTAADVARDRFAATAARLAELESLGTRAAFEQVRLRKQDLQDIVSGSAIHADSDRILADWPRLADRAPLMQRLERGVRETLAARTGSEASIREHADQIVHEAEIAGAIAAVLRQPGANDSDDDQYRELAAEMELAASEIRSAIRLDLPANVGPALLRLNQSCDRCHELFR